MFIVSHKDDEIYKNLEELRIYDIARKINCELLKTKLNKRIEQKGFNKKKI